MKKIIAFSTLISVAISTIFIFVPQNVEYAFIAFDSKTDSGLVNLLFIFLDFVDTSDNYIVVLLGLILLIVVLLEVHYFFVQKVKGVKDFFVKQAIVLGVLIASFFVIPFLTMVLVFGFGYVDLITSIESATEGVIDSEEEITSHIKKSSTVINVYDASNKYGLVLAQRDLIDKENRSSYEAMVLPYLVKFLPADKEQKNYFVPVTNSFVYTNFVQRKTDKVLAELGLNYLRTNTRSAIVEAYNTTPVPSIVYLSDDAYVPFMQRKDKEAEDEYIASLENTLAEISSLVSRCDVDKISNEKLVFDQEKDHAQNCVQEVHYADCSELRNNIEANKKINADNEIVCLENRNSLSQQKADLENAKAELSNPDSGLLENNKNELSNGMYFPDSQSVYMRIIDEQDSTVYLRTLLHELFHHYSAGGSELPVFLNEGITEYFTLKSMGLSDYEMAMSSGYSRETQVVMSLLEKMPEEDLLESYFSNSSEVFENVFKNAFPEADYDLFLDIGDQIFLETYEAADVVTEMGFWDTDIEHPLVKEVRLVLGLEEHLFYVF